MALQMHVLAYTGARVTAPAVCSCYTVLSLATAAARSVLVKSVPARYLDSRVLFPTKVQLTVQASDVLRDGSGRSCWSLLRL